MVPGILRNICLPVLESFSIGDDTTHEVPRFDSPFSSPILLFRNLLFSRGLAHCLTSILAENGEGTLESEALLGLKNQRPTISTQRDKCKVNPGQWGMVTPSAAQTVSS